MKFDANMTYESLFENLFIYHDNLSIYYLGSIFVTVLSIFLAWWYTQSINGERLNTVKDQPVNEGNISDTKLSQQSTDEFSNSSDEMDNEENATSQVKLGRQSLLAEKIAAGLTQEQLQEEREVEQQQLQAIFQLLQNQEDKFQVASLEDLEDQLRLYRP